MQSTPRRDEKQHADANGVLAAALEYLALGLSIIPIALGTKKPPKGWKWKEFQGRLPTVEEVRFWFGDRHDLDLAVILGAASGGLACRDFDDLRQYKVWAAAHPDLAAKLPTVHTPRPGRHVYFHVPPAWLIFRDLRPAEDGEFRADHGHYCLLPPSRGENGKGYLWGVPLRVSAANLFLPTIDDPIGAGLLPGALTTQRNTDHLLSPLCSSVLQQSSDLDEAEKKSRLEPLCGGADDIERILTETLPSSIGRRHRALFELARAFKAVPELASSPVDTFEPLVRRWHARGRAAGVIGTVDAEESWLDFLHAWPLVKFPRGKEPIMAILQQARDEPLPRAADKYTSPSLKLLVGVCRQLQRSAGDGPFYLSCRTAAKLVGLGDDHVKAWKWLFLLLHDGVIVEVEKGSIGKKRASCYRYLRD